MRRPQPPRRARRLLAPITSPPVSGFITYGRLAAPTLHNEAESGSLALRLTGSPHEASPHGLLRLTLARLPVEWAIDRVSSFQPTRSARFILALHTLICMYAPIGDTAPWVPGRLFGWARGRRHKEQCRRRPRRADDHSVVEIRPLNEGAFRGVIRSRVLGAC